MSVKSRGMIGNVREEFKDQYLKITGDTISQTELRLLPYLFFCALDQRPIEREKITNEEKYILNTWTKKGLCRCYPFSVPVQFCNVEFYTLVCGLLFDGYILTEAE